MVKQFEYNEAVQYLQSLPLDTVRQAIAEKYPLAIDDLESLDNVYWLLAEIGADEAPRLAAFIKRKNRRNWLCRLLDRKKA
jgi:hypothetical protein